MKIAGLAAVCAGVGLATWSGDVRQHVMGFVYAGMIAAAALLAMFFVWLSSLKPKKE